MMLCMNNHFCKNENLDYLKRKFNQTYKNIYNHYFIQINLLLSYKQTISLQLFNLKEFILISINNHKENLSVLQ